MVVFYVQSNNIRVQYSTSGETRHAQNLISIIQQTCVATSVVEHILVRTDREQVLRQSKSIILTIVCIRTARYRSRTSTHATHPRGTLR